MTMQETIPTKVQPGLEHWRESVPASIVSFAKRLGATHALESQRMPGVWRIYKLHPGGFPMYCEFLLVGGRVPTDTATVFARGIPRIVKIPDAAIKL